MAWSRWTLDRRRAGAGGDRPPRRRRLRLGRLGRRDDRRRDRGHVLHRHRRRRGRRRDRHAREEMAPLRRDEQTRGRRGRRRARRCTSSAIPTAGSKRRSSCAATSPASIRQVRPHRVMTQSPERNLDRIYASHPDHLAAGEADDRRGVSRRPQPLGAPRARRRRPRAVDASTSLDGRRRAERRRTTSTSPTPSTARSRRCCRTRASCPIPTRPRRWCGLDRGDRAGRRPARRPLRRSGASRRHAMNARRDSTGSSVTHPLEMLTGDEIKRAVEIVRAIGPACPRARCSRTSCCTSRTRTSSRGGSRAIRSSARVRVRRRARPEHATSSRSSCRSTHGEIVEWRDDRRHAARRC